MSEKDIRLKQGTAIQKFFKQVNWFIIVLYFIVALSFVLVHHFVFSNIIYL